MGIDRWGKNMAARDQAQRARSDRRWRAQEKWDEAREAETREEAEKKIEEMRLILSVGEIPLREIRLTEAQIETLLQSKQ